MPWLAALYGLKWADVESMPMAELSEYLGQFAEVRRSLGKM